MAILGFTRRSETMPKENTDAFEKIALRDQISDLKKEITSLEVFVKHLEDTNERLLKEKDLSESEIFVKKLKEIING